MEKFMESWAAEELKEINSGDKRLDKLSMSILKILADNPESSIPKAFKTCADIKACYRFFSHGSITDQKILLSHRQTTTKRIKQEPVVLCISDTTSLYYGDKKIEGLGKISGNQQGDCLGIFVHPTIAVTPGRVCLGVIGAKIWEREVEKDRRTTKEKNDRPIEEKESYRWIEGYNLANEMSKKAPKTQVIHITDREGDFLEYFKAVEESEGKKADVVVRCSYFNRGVESEEKSEPEGVKLLGELQKAPILGRIEFETKETTERKARKVVQTIRATTVKLKGNKKKNISGVEINAVMAIEENPPEKEKPLCWILLTTLSINTFDQAVKVIEYYMCRWEIEIFIKVLKSGCEIEKRFLQTTNRLHPLIAMFLVVAWRVMYVMMMGRRYPEMCCTKFFEDMEWKSVYKVEHKGEDLPKKPPCLGEYMGMIAHLGGYIGRNNDPPPGPKMIWRGLSRMTDFAIAWEAFHANSNNLKI